HDALPISLGEVGARLLPRCPEPLAMFFDVLAARVGQVVDVAALARLAADEAFVSEELERGVDRAGARPPGAAASLFELLHQLVAVARLLLEEKQDCGSHV